MKALLVSVNYGDYLKASAKHNHNKFEEVIVVTTKSDKETLDVCNQYKNYTPVILPDNAVNYHPDPNKKAAFNKGYLLNQGIKYLESKKYKGYLCSTDGDTIFSPNFNKIFQSNLKKLSSKIKNLDLNKMMFGLPRYFVGNDPEYLDLIMKNPDVSCQRNKMGRWVGTTHKIMRTDNEAHERILLGYCQIYYIDTVLREKVHIHAKNPFYYQYEGFSTTMGLDTKMIGSFLTSQNRRNSVSPQEVKACGQIMNLSGKGTCKNGFNFQLSKSHLWGCHIESNDIFCLHIGPPKQNMQGRVTEHI